MLPLARYTHSNRVDLPNAWLTCASSDICVWGPKSCTLQLLAIISVLGTATILVESSGLSNKEHTCIVLHVSPTIMK